MYIAFHLKLTMKQVYVVTHSNKLGTPPFKYLIFGEQSLRCCIYMHKALQFRHLMNKYHIYLCFIKCCSVLLASRNHSFVYAYKISIKLLQGINVLHHHGFMNTLVSKAESTYFPKILYMNNKAQTTSLKRRRPYRIKMIAKSDIMFRLKLYYQISLPLPKLSKLRQTNGKTCRSV